MRACNANSSCAPRVPAPQPTTDTRPSMPSNGRRSSSGAAGSTVAKGWAVFLIHSSTVECSTEVKVMARTSNFKHA